MADPVSTYVGDQVDAAALTYDPAAIAGLPGYLSDSVQDVIADRDDAGAWAALAWSSLSLASEALPPGVMDELQGALIDAIGQGAAAVGNTLDAIGGIPIIGQAIDFLWEYIGGPIVEEAQNTAAEKIKRSRLGAENARVWTLSAAMEDNPNAMVLAPSVGVLNYPQWISGSNYELRPSFRPTLKSPLMFGEPSWGISGRCFGKGSDYRIKGVAARLPGAAPSSYRPGRTSPNAYWPVYASRTSTKKIDNAWDHRGGTTCDATVALSALYYPYIIGQRKIVDYGLAGRVGTGGANRLLIAYQTKLLADPETNFGVDLKRAQRLAASFAKWWKDRADEKGIRIDARKRPPGEWTQGEHPDFYMENGIVRGYAEKDLHTVGVTSLDDPSRLVSIADRNAVVGQTLALARARAEMLRNTGAMRQLQASGAYIEPAARAAVDYSASQQGLLPRVSRPKRAPLGSPKRGYDLGALDGGIKSPGFGAVLGAVGAVGAAAVAITYFRGK